MPAPLTFAIAQGMTWNNFQITDHNRKPINIEWERIENSARMANGTLRKYVVADKRTFSTSWEMVPSSDNQTVDGFMGAIGMKNFYEQQAGVVDLVVTYGNGTVETIPVVITEFSLELVKRAANMDLYNVSISLEEV